MINNLLNKLENPRQPFLGPNIYSMELWGLLLPRGTWKRYFCILIQLFVITFTATEYIDIWFVRNNIRLLLHNLKITMLATVTVTKITTFLLWQEKWHKIIDFVNTVDFAERKIADNQKRIIIEKYTKDSRRITYIYWSLTYTTGIIVILLPIMKYILSFSYRENIMNGREHYLEVVSSWMPFDKSSPIGYVVASLIQILATVFATGIITSYDTNSIAIMIFFRGQLELLKKDCTEIFFEKGNQYDILVRLKKGHRRHLALIKNFKMFDRCLSPVMFLYVIVCSVMLCVTAYQITIETSAAQKFMMAEYLVFGVAQLFIYCWYSNDLYFVSQSLRSGTYQGNWWSTSNGTRKHMFIFTAQLSRTLIFTAGPFTKLTLSTFFNIVKGAYSYYTILQQSAST